MGRFERFKKISGTINVRVKQAAKQHAKLAARFEELYKENRLARARHALVAGCCEVLHWVRAQHHQSQLSAEEQLLLEELSSLPAVSQWPDGPAGATREATGSTEAAAAGTDRVPEPLMAPDDDPLWVFKHLVSRPPFPGAADVDIQQLVDFYNESCKELALHSRTLENPDVTGPAAAHTLAAAQAVILHFYHLLMTLMMHSSTTHIVLALSTVNCVTGEAMLEHSPQSFERALQHMTLSLAQQERIAYGCSVLKQLHVVSLQEAAALRQQLGPAAVSDADELWASACLPACMRQPGLADLQHQQQQDDLRRLRVVLKKQHFLQMCFSAFVLGSLTVSQTMEMCLTLYPFYARLNQVGAHATRQHLQRQQEQQQRQQEQQVLLQQQQQQAKKQAVVKPRKPNTKAPAVAAAKCQASSQI